MIDYIGLKCPVCGKPFAAHDDIVVCPECGAPYHRTCYEQAGACVFAEQLHGTGKTWVPTQEEQAQESNAQDNSSFKRCPRCGKMNTQNALFCDQCGQSLIGYSQPHPNNSNYQNYGSQQNQSPNNGFPPFGGFPMNGDPNHPGGPIPFILDPMGGVNPAELIDDIPAGDVAKLVQNNTPYYMPTFMNLKRFGKSRFNFCAFLFSGGWLLYRKQYKIGAIITAVMTALYIASIYVNVYFSSGILTEMFQKVGVTSDSLTLTPDQWQQMSVLLFNLPPLKMFLIFLPSLIFFIQLIIMFAVGFLGNKLYCQHCIDTIHGIANENLSSADYTVQLQSRGGVNTSLAICLLICYMIIIYLPRLL